MNNSGIITQGENENFDVQQNEQKLHILVKEFFNYEIDDFNRKLDYFSVIKESTRFYNYAKAVKLDEIFINYDYAAHFLVINSPFLGRVEDYLKIRFSRHDGNDAAKKIKEFFTKWAFNRSEKEKKYFAASTLGYIDKNPVKNNFFFLLVKAVVLIYDTSLRDIPKALSILNDIKNILNSINISDTLKKELEYYIAIFEGFSYLTEKNYADANEAFQFALTINSFGINAKFYLALTEIESDNQSSAFYHLKEILNIDQFHLESVFAFKNQNIINYFINNSYIQNILTFPSFAAINFDLEGELSEKKQYGKQLVQELEYKITKLRELKLEEYYDENIEPNINFINSVLVDKRNHNNIFFYILAKKLDSNFSEIVKKIEHLIKQTYYKKVAEDLKVFEMEIDDKTKVLEKLNNQLDNFYEQMKEKIANTIKVIEENCAKNVAFLEERITNIGRVKKLNPQRAFSNTMSYNFILALLIFLIGGFAGYSNSIVNNSNEYSVVMSMVLVTGIKWGGISFLIGSLISIIVAGRFFLKGLMSDRD